MTKKVTFASGLRSDWNSGRDMRKELPKKQTLVQISVGGLDDSDAEAVNPFPKPKPESSMPVLSEEGRDLVQRDLSPSGKSAKNLTGLAGLSQK